MKSNLYEKDLSVCLVNYNAKDVTLKCLASIRAHTNSLNYEILLVDNNSKDDSLEAIRRLFPEITLIGNKTNLGFAKACNQAIALAKGKYVLLLNNDTLLFNNALKAMVDFLEAHPKVGGVSSKLLESDCQTVIRTCRAFPSIFTTIFSRTSLLTRLFPNNPWTRHNLQLYRDLKSTFEIDWTPFAAFMVRHDALFDVGLLDETFFMYWEDTDMCKRLNDAGWKIFYMPNAEIIHHKEQGGGKRSLLLQIRLIYHKHYSAYNYFNKHYLKGFLRPVAILVYMAMLFLVAIKVFWECLSTFPQRLLKLSNGIFF